MKEIKIAEIVQMTCEEAEENNFVLLCQEGQQVRADVVEVECELDEEVAQLTGAGQGEDADLPDLDTFQVRVKLSPGSQHVAVLSCREGFIIGSFIAGGELGE